MILLTSWWKLLAKGVCFMSTHILWNQIYKVVLVHYSLMKWNIAYILTTMWLYDEIMWLIKCRATDLLWEMGWMECQSTWQENSEVSVPSVAYGLLVPTKKKQITHTLFAMYMGCQKMAMAVEECHSQSVGCWIEIWETVQKKCSITHCLFIME